MKRLVLLGMTIKLWWFKDWRDFHYVLRLVDVLDACFHIMYYVKGVLHHDEHRIQSQHLQLEPFSLFQLVVFISWHRNWWNSWLYSNIENNHIEIIIHVSKICLRVNMDKLILSYCLYHCYHYYVTIFVTFLFANIFSLSSWWLSLFLSGLAAWVLSFLGPAQQHSSYLFYNISVFFFFFFAFFFFFSCSFS